MSTLSVIIITHNEAHNIVECLDLVQWAHECIVVDNGSTDNTVALARAHGARVISTPDWPGFGAQKNRALAEAKSEWVLSIDADERVPLELQREIQLAIQAHPTSDTVAFAIPRLSNYCGQLMRFGGWQNDYVTRLFKRTQACFSTALVHERLEVTGTVQRLHQPLLHNSFRDFSDVMRKMEHYSTAGAIQAFQRGRRSHPLAAVGHGLWTFIRTYLIQQGFRDGTLGFALAISNAESTYYRYMKLWLLGRSINMPTASKEHR